MTSESLEEFIGRLTEDSAVVFATEDATKQGVILPILARLGWDRDNVREVIPEYRVGSGRVDYCLALDKRSRVFVEAKRTDQDLTKHQEQLLAYAFQEGIELAVLTNGVLWWLYLPLLEGSWDQRKFLTIDVLQQGASEVADNFHHFLAKDQVESGGAITRAKRLHQSRSKERLTAATLPRAWSLLCEEPDELLVELVSEKVESLCGHQPDPEQVAQHLQLVSKGPYSRYSETEKTRRQEALKPSSVAKASRGGFTSTRPTGFTLFGSTHSVSSFKEILIKVCALVSERHPKEFDRVLDLKGRKRDYFSRDYRGMRTPEAIPKTDIFVETHMNANTTVKRCIQVLTTLGYSKDDLHIRCS